jgi:hypothetical protein
MQGSRRPSVSPVFYSESKDFIGIGIPRFREVATVSETAINCKVVHMQTRRSGPWERTMPLFFSPRAKPSNPTHLQP